MIKDIPTPQDFETVGIALLNQAWDTALTLYLNLHEIVQLEEDREDKVESEQVEEYWSAANTKLATALSIAQQGAEFLLKARIVAVSPFLLIANPAREWPKGNEAGNISFSLFRTVDAQDLVRLHNSCAPSRVSPEFITRFDALRMRRNTIMHTVDKKVTIHVRELVESVLAIHKELASRKGWITMRRDFLDDSEDSTLYSNEWVQPRLVQEFDAVRTLLDPKAMKEHFGHDKSQRVYICPSCSDGDFEVEVRLAVLRPNKPTSTEVWCFVCDKTDRVIRTDCRASSCRGNVISQKWERCLTCGSDHTKKQSKHKERVKSNKFAS